jgi:hypothetical protein
MKTTIDIPDRIFRTAKARAALRGISLKQFVTEAIEEKVAATASRPATNPEPPWMRGFGALADLREETRLIDREIEEMFGRIQPEDLK